MKEPNKTAPAAGVHAPQEAAGMEALADLYRFGLSAALDAQRRALELAGRQHALATRAAREAVGAWEGAGERFLADATRFSAGVAERAGEILGSARPA